MRQSRLQCIAASRRAASPAPRDLNGSTIPTIRHLQFCHSLVEVSHGPRALLLPLRLGETMGQRRCSFAMNRAGSFRVRSTSRAARVATPACRAKHDSLTRRPEDTGHDPDRKDDLVRSHETGKTARVRRVLPRPRPPPLTGYRSWRRRGFPRRRRISFSRSVVVAPSLRLPASRSAWRTHRDGLRGRFELSRQLCRRSLRSDQLDHLPPELRRIRASKTLHRKLQRMT